MAQPRFKYRRSFFSGYFTTGVKWLLIINTAVFLLWAVSGPAFQSQVLRQFALGPEITIHELKIWQIVTYLFLHASMLLSMCSLALSLVPNHIVKIR